MLTDNGQPIRCRLCDGSVSYRFSLDVLQKHSVKYFLCTQCGSLQTEVPFWLDEAYKIGNLSRLDTGVAQRNIHNVAGCVAISRLFGVRNAIDLGGGDGLLCRLLRDYEINCYVKDRYAIPSYAQGFTEEDFATPDLVIGFEVLEHFSNPKSDLDDIFKHDADILLLSTDIYRNEKEDWWYLLPESGQHVFFYSEHALGLIAKKYGYSLIRSGGFLLYVRNATGLQKVVARFLLRPSVCRVIRALIFIRRAPGVWKDHRRLLESVRQRSNDR